jgi:hypothetical protein
MDFTGNADEHQINVIFPPITNEEVEEKNKENEE